MTRTQLFTLQSFLLDNRSFRVKPELISTKKKKKEKINFSGTKWQMAIFKEEQSPYQLRARKQQAPNCTHLSFKP